MDGVGDLERWAADARAREAADARVRERWLRAQAAEGASMAGVLLDLAERRETVVVATVAGRRHRGVVTGVGEDFVAMQAPSGTITLVALSALGDVRLADRGSGPGSRVAASTGDRPGRGSLGARLADVLAQAAGGRPRILVQTGAASVVGDLRAVGLDVLTVQTDGDAGPVYVWLPSLSEISFLASG
ncbi:MAG: hypothetical protein M3450_09345 [Actinomycetota bacterium]|nr:hypothetical protein [Actinomycetota bacterium]